MAERTKCAKARRPKLVAFYVKPAIGPGWYMESFWGTRFHHHATKRDAIDEAIVYAKASAFDGRPASVRVQRRDGKWEKNGERTYPRSADPRSSRG